jgi:hypothetical protein
MQINLGQLTTLTLIADMSTPAEFVALHGTRLTLPESVTLPPIGEYSEMSGSGITVYGATRMNGPELEWVMTAAIDPALVEVDKIPGAGGWDAPVARQGYFDQAKYLQGQGITGAVLWPGLMNFYEWAKQDLIAKGWSP